VKNTVITKIILTISSAEHIIQTLSTNKPLQLWPIRSKMGTFSISVRQPVCDKHWAAL